MPILPNLTGPADLRGLDEVQLAQLAPEIRETIIATVASTGGHLGSSLGVVELTIALHRLLESPRDRIVWDTGHQAYPHKLLTGRLERFGTLRQLDGVGGFPRRSESRARRLRRRPRRHRACPIAEGLAEARDIRHGLERIAVVVGDAALMSGLSLEALNDIGQRQTQMLIVRQRQRDVDQPDGRGVLEVPQPDQALERLAAEQERLRPQRRADPGRRPDAPRVVAPPARVGRPLRPARASCSRTSGITYIGVVPGHDLHALLETLGRALALPGPDHRPRPHPEGPRLPSGRDRPDRVPRRGAAADDRADACADASRWPTTPAPPTVGARRPPKKHPNYTAVFAAELMDLARTDRRIVGITAGMPTGTGLSRFQAEFPDRFFDVGIAEQHAMTFATGLAMGGMRPVVALYSTFLQRAFDQTVHDVCQNDQPVLIAVDRAGLVGEDGTSHQGMFTLPAQRQLPNLVIASPEGRAGAALAAPHGLRPGPPVRPALPARRGLRARRRSSRRCSRSAAARSSARAATCCSSASGRSCARAIEAADALEAEGWSVGVINARFAKPLDRQLILDQARGKPLVVTFEESVVSGGFGSGVLEAARGGAADRPGAARGRGPDRRHPGRPVRRPRLGRRTSAACSVSTPTASPRRSARRWRSLQAAPGRSKAPSALTPAARAGSTSAVQRAVPR